MSKFNRTTIAPARGNGPIVTAPTPTLVTHEGAPAYQRDARGELFLLGVSNMVGEDTFYESAADRDARFRRLVREVAVSDPAWMLRFLRWLRADGNMRSAPLVAAAEFVKARLDAGVPSVPAYDVLGFDTGRGVERVAIDVVCQRPDEPGELLAYWMSQHGRAVPKPVKRGLADAVRRLYNEYGLLKYDTGSHGVRFGDVLDLVHPSPVAPWQGALFRYALDRRHGLGDVVPDRAHLPMVVEQLALRAVAGQDPGQLLDPEALKRAGMTWEDALSLAGSRVDKRALWEALIPGMGLMALARNLRNFDEAGVSDQVAALVAARFADPAQVARSRMFPYRWLAAYQAAPSLRWGHPLDQALTASCSNVPDLPGRTLILIDTSASMTRTGLSKRSKLAPVHAAAVFGAALALKGADVDLVGFATGTFTHQIQRGASLIREVDRFVQRVGEVGHSTEVAASLRARYHGHDRVIIVSDEQTMPAATHYVRGGASYGVTNAIPEATPMYCFNLGGYAQAMADWGATNRIELGGLTDATFRMIPLIEAGRHADWPF